MKNNEYLEVGNIVGTFGIKGELKLKSSSDFIDERLETGNTLYIERNNEIGKITISSARFHKDSYLITINGLTDINLVTEYVGATLYVKKSELKDLPSDEYYDDDLIGLLAYNTQGELIGKVVDIVDIPSSSLLEIEDKEGKKILIPFVEAFIKDITEEGIIIEEIEGLR